MAGLVPFDKGRSNFMNVGIDGFHQMFDDFFTDGWPIRRMLAAETFRVDVQEDETNYFISAELPGVKKEEISVFMEEDRLHISATREEKTEESEKNYVHRERRSSSMRRSILITNADPSGIKAKLDDGILSLTVPKKDKADKSVKIEIE